MSCPYCHSERSSLDDGVRICAGCGAEFSLETELIDVRQELADARMELERKENAPIEGRMTDEDRYMVGLLRLQSRVNALEGEERLLLKVLEAE